EGGEHDHRRRAARHNPPRCLDAVAARHLHIHQDHVGAASLGAFRAVEAVPGDGYDVVAEPLQGALEAQRRQPLVFADHDPPTDGHRLRVIEDGHIGEESHGLGSMGVWEYGSMGVWVCGCGTAAVFTHTPILPYCTVRTAAV